MFPVLPPEIYLQIINSIHSDEKSTILNVLRVSHTFHSIAEMRLYEIVEFSSRKLERQAIVENFCQNIAKDNGRLGPLVCTLILLPSSFVSVSETFGKIAKILPLLTHLTHFELNRAYAYYSFKELPSAICSPHLSTFIWQLEGEDQDKRDLVAFLEAHPSIQRLEIPAYELSATLPRALLPCVEKLAIFDCNFLSNHPLQQTISHLALSFSEEVADTKTAEKFSNVQYFSGNFDPLPFMSFASRLPDVRCLYFAPDGFIYLKDICHAAQAQKFQSKQLMYLVILCEGGDHEDSSPAIQGIFKAIPTLRVIDVFNDIAPDAFARYHVEGSPAFIPLAQFPSKWPTDQQLKEALL